MIVLYVDPDENFSRQSCKGLKNLPKKNLWKFRRKCKGKTVLPSGWNGLSKNKTQVPSSVFVQLLLRAWLISSSLSCRYSHRHNYGECTHPRTWHFRYFLIFSPIKNDFAFLKKVNHLFLHQSYLKSPLPVKLTW